VVGFVHERVVDAGLLEGDARVGDPGGLLVGGLHSFLGGLDPLDRHPTLAGGDQMYCTAVPAVACDPGLGLCRATVPGSARDSGVMGCHSRDEASECAAMKLGPDKLVQW
jgi:hypothetical protein